MQFNLCLSCGVPFLPFEDHMIDVSKLGNLSLMYMQKFVRNCEYGKKFENPLFTTKSVRSHMVHQGHHSHAIEFMRKRDGGDLTPSPPSNDDGVFPFYMKPSKNQQPKGAYWAAPETRLNFNTLFELVRDIEIKDDRYIDLNKTFQMCESCNSTMTMKFWFQQILYKGREPLIDSDVITIVKMNPNNRGLDKSDQWVIDFNPNPRTFPGDQIEDALGPAIAYYLHMCLPEDDMDQKQKDLYQFLCWVILEISCLLCEYEIGPENNKNKKKNQLFKSHVGTIEIYISYFFWVVLQFKGDNISRMSFENWHQIYFCEIKHCKELFNEVNPGDFGKMIVDYFTENVEDRNALSLLHFVHDTMMHIYDGFISKLEEFLDGGDVSEPVYDFFMDNDDLIKINQLCNQGSGSNFDTYLKLVGVDVLFFRLIDTCRDLNDEIVDKLRSFNTSWQLIEVNNVSKNRYEGKSRSRSMMEYYMCKITNAPRNVPFDLEGLQKLARKKKCSHWLAALRLRELGAF